MITPSGSWTRSSRRLTSATSPRIFIGFSTATPRPTSRSGSRSTRRPHRRLRRVDESGPGSAGLLLGQVLAPGDHLHAEGDTDARDLSSDVAQPDDPKPFAPKV